MATATYADELKAQKRDGWFDTVDAVVAFMIAHDVEPPYSLSTYSRWGGAQFEDRVYFITHDAESTRATVMALGGGTKVEGTNGPYLVGESHGFKWALSRTDLTCELVETDEVEEVEETEVVTPAETRTVKVQRPKMRKVCPPILADEVAA